MRQLLLALPFLLFQAIPAQAQVSVGIGVEMPGVSIGINLPAYPDLQRVPGYPVYYAPQAPANYFFHDGLYWVFQGDDWYASSWYNGPWRLTGRDRVPVFLLRVPVRYYNQPPAPFASWRSDAPPRWGEHWGDEWQKRRPGWDRWDRHAVQHVAPLPDYQRKYPQSRYPHDRAQQQAIRSENVGHRPPGAVIRVNDRGFQDESPRKLAPHQGRPERDAKHGKDGGHGRESRPDGRGSNGHGGR